MIKLIAKFILGFIIGIIIAFAITYAIGYSLETMGISLYDSESDQQRNFNIYILFSLLVATSSGYLATKIGKKTNK